MFRHAADRMRFGFEAATGTIYSWGYNQDFRLGRGDVGGKFSPKYDEREPASK